MTLEQLERSLPNGVHDAELVGLHVDYAAREAVLTVNVDIGDSDDDASQSSENYRAARIRFFEIQFVVTDPPTTGDSYSGLSMIDTGSGEPRTSPCSLPPIRKDCFLCWIFVTQWNSFIRISARDVALEWGTISVPRILRACDERSR